MNDKKYYIIYSLIAVAYLLFGGTVMQIFLAEMGVAEEIISTYVFVMQIIQMVAVFGCSMFVDRIKNVIKTTALSQIIYIPIALAMIFVCYFRDYSVGLLFGIIVLCSVLFYVGYGMWNVLSYKLPYHIINMSQYGRLTAMGGAAAGVVTVVLSGVISFFQYRANYFSMMLYIGIISVLMILWSVKTTFSFEEYTGNERSENKEQINIFKYKPFLTMILPDFTRAFCLGIVNVAVTIGYYLNLIDVKSSGIFLIVSNAIVFIASLLYTKIDFIISTKRTILISSLALIVSMPLMAFTNSTIGFLVFYGITFFFINLLNIAVPVAVTRFVDYNLIGKYNGYRMLINACGMAFAGLLCIKMSESLGAVATLLISSLCQCFSGMVYYIYLRKNTR